MKILSFLQSLLPNFKKDQILEDLKVSRTEIKEFTIPSYESSLGLLKTWKFKHDEIKDLQSTFNRMVKDSGHGNMVEQIHNKFKIVLENTAVLEKMVETTYSEDIAGAGLTYLKANMLQFVEFVGFTSNYARKLLIYIYILETSLYEESKTVITESLSPAEVKWIKDNFISFCVALNIVGCDSKKVKKSLDDIPDIVITTDNYDTLSSTMGETKLDPFQMKLIATWVNPIYHVRMFIAEWQADRYKVAKEELKLLQLRKLNLEKISSGKPDAHLEKEIEYMESRIQSLNYKVKKMEEAHA